MKLEAHRGEILFLAGVLAALGLGWSGSRVARFERVSQPVAFSHKVHTDTAGMKCEDCHALRDDGTFTGIPSLEKCSGCHTQPMGATPQERAFIDRYVKPNREVPWQVYARQPENVYFSHAYHIKEVHLECRQCHGGQGQSDTSGPAEVNRISGYSGSPHFLDMDACMDCHRQQGAADSCLACHK